MREAAQRIREVVGTDGPALPSQRSSLGNVGGAVDWALASTARELLHRARITREVAAVPSVVLGQARIGQVLVHLLLNAAHAIEPGKADENEVRVRVRSPERDWVVLEVSDTGHGVPPALASRVFDPFFTTKPVGRGTGFGLYVCKSIVEAVGGRIQLESMAGVGSTLRVSLPVARETSCQEGVDTALAEGCRPHASTAPKPCAK